MAMAFLPLLLLLLLHLLLQQPQSDAQQSYFDAQQWSLCTTALDLVCNAAASCPSYLTFRSTQTYNNSITIGSLLSAVPSQISAANNISDVDTIPEDTLVIVPVNCSCSQTYYQHNTSYVLKRDETYSIVANNIYQYLTACQSMVAQNPYNISGLYPNLTLSVPLRCACPTPAQTAAGYKYLITYPIRPGDTVPLIANAFGSDVQGMVHANQLPDDLLIYSFTPILVPLKTEPTKVNLNGVASPPSPLPPPAPTTPVESSGSSSKKWVLIGVGTGAAVLILFTLLALVRFFGFCHRQRQHRFPLPDASGGDAAKAALSSLPMSSSGIRGAIETLTVYTFKELEKATDSFTESKRINGSSVYRGSFKGDEAVVKIMKGDVSKEINVLRQINHSHIIRLSGFCLHQGITYLVYEYAERGSLSEWLHASKLQKKDHDDIVICQVLDWKQRLQVAYDVADALNYLHNFTNPSYIHKNLKSSNVLLDSNMRAKIANFGFARSLDTDDQAAMTRHVVGTYGYMAPEYVESGLVTPKLDVFALGVVMLELLSGKEPTGDKGDQLLVLSQRIEEVLGGENVSAKLQEFMDPQLGQ